MWFLRFSLGLPARKSDIQELRKELPELFSSNNLEPTTKYFSFQASCFGNLSKVEFWNALQRWITDYNNEERDEINLTDLYQSVQKCPAETCPLRENQSDDDALSTNKDKFEKQYSTKNSQNAILEVMHIGGGKYRNPPLKQFLDLVQNCHKNCCGSNIKEVIVTDRYINDPVNNTGVGGGYSNFVEYLNILKLNSNSEFILKFARGDNSEKYEILERTLKDSFPRISFGSLSSESRFHDRFYLARYKNGKLKGVFGPSMNGLNAKSVVLIGELEENTLQWLDKLI